MENNKATYVGHKGVGFRLGRVNIVIIIEVEPNAPSTGHIQNRRQQIKELIAGGDQSIRRWSRGPKRLDVNGVGERDQNTLLHRLKLVLAFRTERHPVDIGVLAPAARELLHHAAWVGDDDGAAAEADGKSNDDRRYAFIIARLGGGMSCDAVTFIDDIQSVPHGREVLPWLENGEESAANSVEDGVIGNFQGCCGREVVWVEETLTFSVGAVVKTLMGSASCDEDFQSRRHVVADIDREIK